MNIQPQAYRLRWWTLAVLSVALALAAMDTTIVNLAIPAIQRDLGASGSVLQWIVNSYFLVFAGLLLTMGLLGDRFGRKTLLQIGVAVFALGSLFAAYSQSSEQLIAARALTGIAAAMMMPATLSIVVAVFPREERAKAIAIWSAVAGIGVPLGQILSGLLLEYFWWGSVFLISLPVCGAILVASLTLVPNSRDERPLPVDLAGAILSTGMLSSLVFAIIEAPSRGWTDSVVLAGFGGALALGVAFVAYELRTMHPMLDVRLLRNRRMSAGAGAIVVAFLGLLGAFFLLTQFLQIVRGYSPLETGLIFTTLALAFGVASGLSERGVKVLGTNRVAAFGLGLVAVALVGISFFGMETDIWAIVLWMVVLGLGVGSVMAPGTEAMMGAVPEANVGVGAALNEETRLVGIALGVSILGSIANSIFASNMEGALSGLTAQIGAAAQDSIGAAIQVAGAVGGPEGEALRSAANFAFVDASSTAILVGAGIAFTASALVLFVMPGRATLVPARTTMESTNIVKGE